MSLLQTNQFQIKVEKLFLIKDVVLPIIEIL